MLRAVLVCCSLAVGVVFPAATMAVNAPRVRDKLVIHVPDPPVRHIQPVPEAPVQPKPKAVAGIRYPKPSPTHPPSSPMVCRLQALQAEGSPDKPFVLVCASEGS